VVISGSLSKNRVKTQPVMKSYIKSILAGATLLAVSSSAAFASFTFSFTDYTGPGDPTGVVAVSGSYTWDSAARTVSLIVTNQSGIAAGTNFATITGIGALGANGTITNVSTINLPGSSWTLQNPFDLPPVQNGFIGFNTSGTQNAIIPGVTATMVFTYAEGATFNYTSGPLAWLRFQQGDGQGGPDFSAKMAIIPEPSTVISLIAAAFLGLVVWRRMATRKA
jgi:hypothetical protein